MTGRDVSSDSLPRFDIAADSASLPRFALPDESSESDLARTMEVRRSRSPDVCGANVPVEDILEDLRAAAVGRPSRTVDLDPQPDGSEEIEELDVVDIEDQRPAGVPRPWMWNVRSAVSARYPAMRTVVTKVRDSHRVVPVAAAVGAFLLTLVGAYVLRGPLEWVFETLLSQ